MCTECSQGLSGCPDNSLGRSFPETLGGEEHTSEGWALTVAAAGEGGVRMNSGPPGKG